MAENDQFNRQTSSSSTGGKMNYWDIFRKDISGETNQSSTNTDYIFRVVKIIVYIILFVLVFGGNIITRASLHILTNEYQKQENAKYSMNLAKEAIAYYLLFILTIPDALKVVLSFFRFIFGKRETPTIIQLLVMILKECLHGFSLAIIVFMVLPKLNSIEVCAYLSGIPFIPSILHAISYGRFCSGKCCKQLINLVSISIQLAAIGAVPVYKYMNDHISIEDMVWMIAAAVFVSIRWFETYFVYVDEDGVLERLLGYHNRPETHCISTLITSFCRLVLICAIFPTYFVNGVHEPGIAFTSKPENWVDCISVLNTTNCTLYAEDWYITPFCTHFFVCAGLFYAAVLATKVCMDRISFCFALSISTPIYVIIILISRVNNNWISDTFIPEASNSDVYVAAVIFLIAWLSQLWICRHIWQSGHDRLAFENKLFVLPHYCSPIADLSLLHSRKPNPKKEKQNKKEKSDQNKKVEPPITKVFICATMWHENRIEMKQIMKTFFRLDLDQAARLLARNHVKETSGSNFFGKIDEATVKRDYYDFEAHIMFDDAMETNDNQREPNELVKQLMEVISEAGTAIHMKPINMEPPDRLVTPYGGRLVWTLPGENKLVVHLKDKDKIRHKKRWSQIMYMYYLLGYKLVQTKIETLQNTDLESAKSIFNILPTKIQEEAANTYVMALDGDVDFSPKALHLLIDRMKKNPKVGATCGRIKPGGSGPVVWYQKFEYAIGHWLQKSAEHVFGCVLCSPGCFSLFRAKALMDDNMMRTYASLPTEPKHYLQYDQGEDRWLCTLMLQQGYRIEYCAAAEALTFAPEDFREFFNQRRRWMPSTMANILDLLLSYKETTKKNSNISYLFIFYQAILFLSSILGPSTVLLALQSAVRTVFGTDAWVAYLLTYAPTIIFIFICLRCKTQTQLTVAMILSAIYAMLMMAVIVGTIVSIAQEGIFTPTAVFMYVLIGIFLIAGLFHPHELTDLFWGTMYFVCIPAGYLFLIIYAICNLNNVSWGTRETQKAILEQQPQRTKRKKKTEEEFGVVSEEVIDDILKQVKSAKTKTTSCRDLLPSVIQWLNNLIILRSLESVQNIFKNSEPDEKDGGQDMQRTLKRRVSFAPHMMRNAVVSDQLDDQSWAKENGKVKKLKDNEVDFWKDLIINYLKPLEVDKEKEKAEAQSLKEFRDKVAFAFFFVNALWLVIMSAMNEVKGVLNIQISAIGNTTAIEPLGLLFLAIFAILLLLQFIGMIRHRYGTLLHILAATHLKGTSGDSETIINKIKSLASSTEERDYEITDTQSNAISANEIDDIYENWSNSKVTKRSQLGKSIKRPTPHTTNAPFNLKQTFKKNVQAKRHQMQSSHPQRHNRSTDENRL